MSKIFETQFEKGSYIDSVDHLLLEPFVISGGSIERTEKGMAWKGSADNLSLGSDVFNKIIKSNREFTVAFYLRTGNDITTLQCLMGSSDNTDRFMFAIEGGILRFSEIGGEEASSSALEKNTWYCVVCSQTSSNIMSLYVNNVLQTGNTSCSSHYAGTYTILGAAASGVNALLNGHLGKAVIYDDIIDHKERNRLQSEFNSLYPVAVEKHPRHNPHSKPTDLSREVYKYDGEERIIDGDFPNGDNWVEGTAWSIANNKASYDDSGNSTLYCTDQVVGDIVVGDLLVIKFTITEGTAQIALAQGNGSQITGVQDNYGVGTHILLESAVLDATLGTIGLRAYTGGTAFSVTNFSVKKALGLLGAFNFIANNGVVSDLSGVIDSATRNNTDLSLIGGPDQTVNGIHFDGVRSYLIHSESTNTSLNPGTSDFTISFRVMVPVIPPSSKYLFGKGGGGSEGFAGYINASGQINSDIHDGTSRETTPSVSSLVPGKFHNINFVYDRDDVVSIYIDGVLDTTEDISSVQGPIDITTRISFGCLGVLIAAWESEFEDWRIDSYAYTPDQVKAYNNKFAKRPVLVDDFSLDKVGDAVPNGWVPNSGAYEIKESAVAVSSLSWFKTGTKYLECNTAGRIIKPSKSAYGTWQFTMKKDLTASVSYVVLAIVGTWLSGDTGYYFAIGSSEQLLLVRRVSGSSSTLFSTANSYVDVAGIYEFKIERTHKGEFTAYIRGGDFGDVFVAIDVSGGSGTNPVTDNTNQESDNMVFDLADGDFITKLNITDGVVV
jgi:hypothetical protein